MSFALRNAAGGLIDRAHPLRFTVDGRPYEGFAGDTLASALMANGVRLMGRSFKYHRPRGVFGAGVEEPNALYGVGEGGRFEPNTRATDVFLYEGLTAISQNRWPNLAFDIGALNQVAAPFIPAGFYYKTFFGGPRLWKVYEHVIRRAAGLGKPTRHRDVDRFDHRSAFCDVLVIGAGPAGLAAADAAAAVGACVMLVDQDRLTGGGLLRDPATVAGDDGLAWATGVATRVKAAGGRVLTRSTATGFYDHGLVNVVQRHVEPGQITGDDRLAQTLWRVRARRVVLAQGNVERPLLFSGNDRPGVMLASAARSFVARYAVRPGALAVVAGCDDHADLTARVLAASGVGIITVLDSRAGGRVVAALGSRTVTGAIVFQAGRTRTVACDLIVVSGGQTPTVHLHMQAGGGLAWDAQSGAFAPTTPRQNQISAGAGAGRQGLEVALADGWRAGVKAAQDLGLGGPSVARPRGAAARPTPTVSGCCVTLTDGADAKTAFIDLQNDVTAADIDLASRQGYRSVEHLKRFTTLGMASDQGKTSNLLGLGRMAWASGVTVPRIGLTTFRPPYTPVTLGVLAGGAVGAQAAPVRSLTLQSAHEAAGATWQPSGYWNRPRAYPLPGETVSQAALREARTVRDTVGLTDVSTLGKFEVVGPDAAAFLEIVCATSVAKLVVGRGRYTIMLREDGIVADDGTVWRLADQRYLLTSSTGGADTMAHRLSYVRRVLSPRFRVMVTAVQERWVGVAVAGPRSRDLVDEAIGAAPPRHMSVVAARIADQTVWLLAASYSGERAFEIYIPSHAAQVVWSDLESRVAAVGGRVYGLDAMDLLRIEKGHLVTGSEIDGRTCPHDLGLTKMLRKGGFIGWAGLQRPEFQRPDRLRLIGLEALDGVLPEGAMLLPRAGAPPQGHVSSAGRRVTGQGGVGLGLVASGPDRIGEVMVASSPTRRLQGRVRLAAPVFYDADGARYVD